MTILDAQGRPITKREPKKPDMREIAAVSIQDKYGTYPSRGLTPEKLARILREADMGDVYRQMELFEEIEEKDPHIFSLMQTRKNAVLGLDWEIIPYSDDPNDRKIAEFVGDVLYNLEDMEDTFLDLLDAIGKGFAVSEIMWEIKNGKAVIGDIKWRPQKKFRFGDNDELRLLTETDFSRDEQLPPYKFIVHKYKAKSGHPSRAGVYRVCSWMYLFKNYTLKDWVAFAEVYGMPLRLGKYKTGASKEDREALVQAVMQLGSDAAGIISESTEIEFVEAKTGNGSIFETLACFCNIETSKAILGQTLTSEVGASGSYAAAKIHADVRQDILESDCKALAKTLRRDLIRPLVLFNFGDATRLPYFKFHYEKPEDTEKMAKTCSSLVEMGLPVATEYIYEKFGIPRPAKGQEILVPIKAAPTTEPMANRKLLTLSQEPALAASQQAIDVLADITLNQGLKSIQKMLEPIKTLISEAESLEDLRDKLLAAYPSLDTSELEDLVARAMFVADLFGRWSSHG